MTCPYYQLFLTLCTSSSSCVDNNDVIRCSAEWSQHRFSTTQITMREVCTREKKCNFALNFLKVIVVGLCLYALFFSKSNDFGLLNRKTYIWLSEDMLDSRYSKMVIHVSREIVCQFIYRRHNPALMGCNPACFEAQDRINGECWHRSRIKLMLSSF